MAGVESHTPPHSLEAEQSVLGSILLDNETYASLEGVVAAGHFYKEGHRKIFRAIERLFRRGDPMDLVTLTEELRQSGELESVGSVPYLIGLADSVPTAAYADSYARIVLEKATLRDLISASGRIMQLAYDQAGPLDEVLDQAEQSIFDLATKKRRTQFEGMTTLVTETFAHINELFANPDPVSGMRTGFKELDTMTAGLQPSSLNVLAARPSMGKTALALSMALNAALRDSVSVGIFSLEMSAVQLVTRMLCSEARVDMSRVRNGQLSDRDFQRLADTAGRMSDARIFIDDNPDLTVMELRSRARRLTAEHDLGLLVIDYLQLMSAGTRSSSENRQQEISAISRGLKALARELDIPVLVLSQLSRAVESRPNKRPMLSDLRECVPGDTLVLLADGSRVPIRELVGTRPEVLAVDETGGIVRAKSDKVWSVGPRPLDEIRLASGRTLRASRRHRVLTGNGWKRVEELAPGDRVALARRLPAPERAEHWADERLALLGQLIGDGSYLKGQPMRYTSGSEENLAIVEAGAKALGSSVARYAGRGTLRQLLIAGNGNRWHAEGVGGWLKELGIFGQRSHEKRIPRAAFRLDGDSLAVLLRHLWAADGCIRARPGQQRGSHAVYYATNSEGLARDVAHVLLRLGIVARIRRVDNRAGDGEPVGAPLPAPAPAGLGGSKVGATAFRPSFHVLVSGARDQLRFLDRVGAFGPRAAPAAELRRRLEGQASSTNVDTLPHEVFEAVRARMRERGISTRAMAAARGTSYGGKSAFAFAPSADTIASYAGLLDDPDLAAWTDNDLYWDRVVSVLPVGEEEVFDLTVPGPANWLADGIVSHNSGAIEQDADLVMFIYRDEYYDQQSEKHGIAEVIIGKQRNGPTGTLELQFHNAHVRFNDLARSP